ncbi:retrovirus-related Pol polyprotein from transposon 412 [Trichonephila clavipes]|nr:retrovirus-related Pol polyprotein from transposon 412 [Trichonephila clavipes]
MKKLKEEMQTIKTGISNQEKHNFKCWGCGGTGHLRRNCTRARKEENTVSSSKQEKLIYDHLVGWRYPDNERPHHKILQITAVNGGDKGLYVIGQINIISCCMVVDTGANVSTIRKDLAQNSKFGNIDYHHTAYIADITDPCILGLDFLKNSNFKLDFESSNMHSKFEDITLFVLQTQFESNQKIIAKAKLSLSPRTECIVPGSVAENRKFRFGLIDYPDPDNSKKRSTDSFVSSRSLEFSHPRPFFRGSSQGFTTKHRRETQMGLIKEFQCLFSSEDFGRTRLTKHRIDTGEDHPIKPHPGRLPFAKQEDQKLINDRKDNYVIESSSSPWASPSSWSRRKIAQPDFAWTIVR